MTSSTPTPPPSASPGKGGATVYPQQPPKDPVLILVMNLLLFGGVGYFMIGQKNKGIAAIVIWVLGLASCGIVSGIVSIVGAIDGWMQAEHLQKGMPVAEWTFFKDHR